MKTQIVMFIGNVKIEGKIFTDTESARKECVKLGKLAKLNNFPIDYGLQHI